METRNPAEAKTCRQLHPCGNIDPEDISETRSATLEKEKSPAHLQNRGKAILKEGVGWSTLAAPDASYAAKAKRFKRGAPDASYAAKAKARKSKTA